MLPIYRSNNPGSLGTKTASVPAVDVAAEAISGPIARTPSLSRHIRKQLRTPRPAIRKEPAYRPRACHWMLRGHYIGDRASILGCYSSVSGDCERCQRLASRSRVVAIVTCRCTPSYRRFLGLGKSAPRKLQSMIWHKWLAVISPYTPSSLLTLND